MLCGSKGGGPAHMWCVPFTKASPWNRQPSPFSLGSRVVFPGEAPACPLQHQQGFVC